MNSKNTRLYPLDPLRGLAAIVIACLFHYLHIFPVSEETHPLYGIPVLWWLTRNGGLFVEMFFIISGLLAYRLSYQGLSSGKLSFSAFMRRKIARLFPVMYFALAILALFHWISYGISGTPNSYLGYNCDGFHFVLNLFGLQYGWLDFVPNFNQPSWYVSVLLLCYCVFAFTCRIIGSSRGRTKWLFPVIIFVGWIMRSGWGGDHPVWNSFMGRGIYTFFLGVCLAIVLDIRDPKINAFLIRLAAIILGIIAALFLLQKYVRVYISPDAPDIVGSYGGIFPIAVFPCLIYLSLTVPGINKIASFKPFARLGEYSYSIYLLNLPVFYLERCAVDSLHLNIDYSSKIIFLVLNGILLFTAVLVHKYFEKPAIAWAKVHIAGE